MSDTTCFGCQKQLAPDDLCIRVGLDEWGATRGLEALGTSLGLDDHLRFAFCEDCTEEHPGGRWTLERVGADV